MKRTLVVLIAACLVVTTTVTFVASPLLAAWSLREAVRTGDSALLARKIDFDGIRKTLRQSLAEHAELHGLAAEAGRAVQPSLWQRVKSAFGATMIDRFIETYISPEGLPKLYKAKLTWNENVRGRPSLDTLPWRDRLTAYFGRLKRAEFVSLSRVEIEIADEHDPGRHFVSSLELHGLEWKLVALHVVRPAASPTAPSAPARLVAGG